MRTEVKSSGKSYSVEFIPETYEEALHICRRCGMKDDEWIFEDGQIKLKQPIQKVEIDLKVYEESEE